MGSEAGQNCAGGGCHPATETAAARGGFSAAERRNWGKSCSEPYRWCCRISQQHPPQTRDQGREMTKNKKFYKEPFPFHN